MTRDLIDDATVERCAKALYRIDYSEYRPWEQVEEFVRKYWRRLARAVLTEALQPTPTRSPLDGQDPLTEETA